MQAHRERRQGGKAGREDLDDKRKGWERKVSDKAWTQRMQKAGKDMC